MGMQSCIALPASSPAFALKQTRCNIHTMATVFDHGKLSTEHQRAENVAEKISNSSGTGELEAQNVELEEKEAARVLRKVDMRLVPMLSLLYLVAFIDRSNSTFGHIHFREKHWNELLTCYSR